MVSLKLLVDVLLSIFNKALHLPLLISKLILDP